MNQTYRTVTIILAVILISSGLIASYVYKSYLAPVSSAAVKVTVEIRRGMTTKQIARLLEEKKVIRSQTAFAWITDFSGKAEKLRAGEYLLDSSKTPTMILEQLLTGKVLLYEVTIPEGLTIVQTAELLVKAGFGSADSFIEAATDAEFITKFGIEGSSAEGYLMPETYRFAKGTSPGEILGKMIFTFFEKVEPLRQAKSADSSLDFGEIVTLASIIEKETANREEYRLISSVFHNRLKKGMLLQADPTVIYGLPNFDGNIRKEDLSYDSPYNTYRYRGLPPGPISNPGLAAIDAALNPAQSDYLYFVATKNEGRHYFSKNLPEHNRAVKKYQLNGR